MLTPEKEQQLQSVIGSIRGGVSSPQTAVPQPVTPQSVDLLPNKEQQLQQALAKVKKQPVLRVRDYSHNTSSQTTTPDGSTSNNGLLDTPATPQPQTPDTQGQQTQSTTPQKTQIPQTPEQKKQPRVKLPDKDTFKGLLDTAKTEPAPVFNTSIPGSVVSDVGYDPFDLAGTIDASGNTLTSVGTVAPDALGTLTADQASTLTDMAGLSPEAIQAGEEAYNAAIASGKTVGEAIEAANAAETAANSGLLDAAGTALSWAGLGYGLYKMATDWGDMDTASRVSTAAGTTAAGLNLAGELTGSAALGAAAAPVGLFALGVTGADIASKTKNPDGIDISHVAPAAGTVLPDGKILMDVVAYKSDKAKPKITPEIDAHGSVANGVDHVISRKETPNIKWGWEDNRHHKQVPVGVNEVKYNTVFDPKTNMFYTVDEDKIKQHADNLQEYLTTSSDWMTPISFVSIKDKPMTFDFGEGFPIEIKSYVDSLKKITEHASWGDDWKHSFMDKTQSWTAPQINAGLLPYSDNGQTITGNNTIEETEGIGE